MGESKHNPNAADFKGEMPDVIPGAEMTWIVVPSAAFLAHMKAMDADGVKGPFTCMEKDRDVVLVAVAKWIIPSNLTRNWPTSQLQMAELARMPLTEFKKAHKAQFEANDMAAAAASIVIQDEKLLVGV